MSKHTLDLSSYSSISYVRNTGSVKTVGDVKYYLLMYVRILMLFTQALPFTLPSRFSFSNTKGVIDLVCSSFVIVLGSTVRNFSYHGAVKVYQ